MAIYEGDLVRISTQDVDALGVVIPGSGFKNASGALTDPTTVKLRWRVAGGTETIWTYGTDMQIVKDSTGVYHADIPVVVKGLHYARWIGTGTVAAASEITFSVAGSFVGTP